MQPLPQPLPDGRERGSERECVWLRPVPGMQHLRRAGTVLCFAERQPEADAAKVAQDGLAGFLRGIESTVLVRPGT